MSRDTEAIRRQMQEVRRELRENAEELAESTRDMVDLRCYIRRYPWASLALGAAVGYLLVPRKSEPKSLDLAAMEKLADRHPMVVRAESRDDDKGSLKDIALRLLLNTAIRGAIGFASHQLTKALGNGASHAADQPSA